jgi:hypothetical protein
VTTALSLRALPALAVAPFTAIAAYLVGVLYASSDDLGRTEPASSTANPDCPVEEAAPAPV